jgi:quercetin dioxygenase-like cupin family protein
VVEIGEGEVIFRREELGVTLLVDVEQLGAVEVCAARGWGKAPLHVHARHAEALFVFEGELALTLEDRVHRVGPETWAFVPPEVVHAFEVTGGVGSTEPPESGGAGFAGAGAGSDERARFLVLHTPCSGFGDYVRGSAAAFDQQPPPEYATGDPGLVVLRRTGGASGAGSTEPHRRRLDGAGPGAQVPASPAPKREESAGAGSAGAVAGDGEKISERPERRSTLLVDTDELTVTEFFYAPGERGAQPHVHHRHADAFLVLEGELTLTVGRGSLRAPAGTFVLFPPDVVHGFDNDGSESALFYNFHMPASGFADYMRGRNPGFDQHDPPADGGADPASAIAVRLSETG